ncbi:SGNH/GDSL hydrolase family protein [Skermania sp. ID1734]|uniref:SGNH/GDSL hydrolase family protein n=1 Tax=Skermania sp. ID1734 TaxID=2597516 RepID=UPI0021035F2F|nr:SGNH/GDSL hydrolase family protein [Skermania sp. ID1734]
MIRALGVTAAVVLTTTATVATATASADSPGTYVALGSSYAAGPDVMPIADVACLRSANDYPHQVAAARHLRLVDVTCSGATTANILRTPQRPQATVPQLDAVTTDTRLVTITIGGNDIGYIGRLIGLSCTHAAPQGLAFVAARICDRGATVANEPKAADFTAVEHAIGDVVKAVQHRAPHADVLLVDYPPVVDDHATGCRALPLSKSDAVATIRIYKHLIAATARAAQATGAKLVRASKAAAAHTVCSAEPWMVGFAPPIPYHPNRAGTDGVARLVLGAI